MKKYETELVRIMFAEAGTLGACVGRMDALEYMVNASLKNELEYSDSFRRDKVLDLEYLIKEAGPINVEDIIDIFNFDIPESIIRGIEAHNANIEHKEDGETIEEAFKRG